MFGRKPQDPLIKSIKSITIKPGDTLVFQCERRVPRDVFDRIRAQLRARFDGDVKLIVLEQGLELTAVLHEEGADA